VLAEEHHIYPLAIGWFLDGRLSVEGGRVLLDGGKHPEQGLDRPETTPQETPKTG
jgi:phosphoribosylglycinamide formyltransferase-1